MKRMLCGLWSVACLLSAGAQTPQFINYQGRLLNGTNLVNGNVGLSLRLFNVASGGTKIYEDSNSVTVADGLYSTFIGDHPTNSAFLSALTNSAVWVEVAVNGTTLTPREPLASVGYSLSTRGLLVTTNGSFVFNPSENSLDPDSHHSTIAGGEVNSIQTNSERSTISGGAVNSIAALSSGSVIAGGEQNRIQAAAGSSSIGGGYQNSIMTYAAGSVIAGGYQNAIQTNAPFSFIGSGQQNVIRLNGTYNFIGGGANNSILANATYSFLGGGFLNSIYASANGSFLGGGQANSIQPSALLSFLGGGNNNQIQTNSGYSVLVGGLNNSIKIDSGSSVIGGGEGNTINSDALYSFIGGGYSNSIGSSDNGSFIGGGYANSASGPYGMVPGGAGNVAGSYSFAAGQNAHATNEGSFVWADSHAADFGTTSSNQFLVRADFVGIGRNAPLSAYEKFGIRTSVSNDYGGMYVEAPGPSAKPFYGYSKSGTTAWTYLDGSDGNKWKLHVGSSDPIVVTPGGFVGIGTSAPTGLLHVAGNAYANAWLTTSDRNAKQDIAPVDAAVILEKISALPVATWSFKAEPDVKHIGPMAQDFRAAFGLGPNDTSIATVDADGVALAAIQALAAEDRRQRTEDRGQQEKISKLERENAELRKQNEEILQRLRALEAK